MRRIQLLVIFCVAILFLSFEKVKQDKINCSIKNTTFEAGEEISFHVFYALAGIYVNAGKVVFSNKLETLNNQTVYHISGVGRTHSSYDWIYKVRDIYETFIDTATLQPLKFIRNINEGGYKKIENISFNNSTNSAITNDGVYKVPDCIQDVLSAIYYARNIDFDNYKVGDRIPFHLFLDNKIFNMHIRYLGNEIIKTRYGTFRAIKFKPLLLTGTIFEGGEKMTVWVSDDKNHIPVRIESPIVVGTIKVDMMNYNHIRYPLSSLIKLRNS